MNKLIRGNVTKVKVDGLHKIGWLNYMFDGMISAYSDPVFFKEFFNISLIPMNDSKIMDGFVVTLFRKEENGVIDLGELGAMIRIEKEGEEPFFAGDIHLGGEIMCCIIKKSKSKKKPWTIYAEKNHKPLLSDQYMDKAPALGALQSYLKMLAEQIVEKTEEIEKNGGN